MPYFSAAVDIHRIFLWLHDLTAKSHHVRSIRTEASVTVFSGRSKRQSSFSIQPPVSVLTRFDLTSVTGVGFSPVGSSVKIRQI
jgi:hypothetical protein